MPKYISIDQNTFIQLYSTQKLSSYQIAATLRVSQSFVMNKLRAYGIKRRTIQEGKALTKPRYPRKNFDGTPIEKAYLIGFRLGDLHVRKTHPNSPTIQVSTNTTKQEQLDLVQNLFSRYGYVREYNRDRRGAISIRCFLNNSFTFLLKKGDEIESWILTEKNLFLAFLGGYIDAEGSFVCKTNKVFSIQTHDKKILHQISAQLRFYGINCMVPRIARRMGTINCGVRSNKDVWQLYIYNRENLIKFINLIKNSIHHAKRKSDMIFLLSHLNHVRT